MSGRLYGVSPEGKGFAIPLGERGPSFCNHSRPPTKISFHIPFWMLGELFSSPSDCIGKVHVIDKSVYNCVRADGDWLIMESSEAVVALEYSLEFAATRSADDYTWSQSFQRETGGLVDTVLIHVATGDPVKLRTTYADAENIRHKFLEGRVRKPE